MHTEPDNRFLRQRSENFRPGVAERLGLGVKRLQALNPRLVYASLSAFGDKGPFAGRPAFDHVVQAHTGIMATTGPKQP